MFQHLKKVDTYSEKLREKFSEKNLYLFDAETISYEIPDENKSYLRNINRALNCNLTYRVSPYNTIG